MVRYLLLKVYLLIQATYFIIFSSKLKMKVMIRLSFFGLISLLMLGCNSSTDKNAVFSVKAKVNQINKVASDLSIEVKSVNDSRCPEGCECVWAGEVKVFFTLTDNKYSIDTSLVLPAHSKLQFRNYTIELESVSPYPICNFEFPNIFTVYFHIVDINKETLLVQGSLNKNEDY